jgi:hypothetical protein
MAADPTVKASRAAADTGGMRPRAPRLSYGNVVSTLALFVALGGTAHAAGLIGTSQIADGAVTSRKIAVGAVGTMRLAGNGVDSTKVKNGSPTAADVAASTFQPYRPSAWALVKWDGTVPDANYADGIDSSNVVKPAATSGVYCLSGIAGSGRRVSVTSVVYFSSPSVVSVEYGQDSSCPVGTQYSILTEDVSAHVLSDASFLVSFY